MNEKIKNQYDSLYTAEKDVFGGGRPESAVQKLSDYLPEGTVLDVGGGEGRNALYLAEQGYTVSVYDISKVGLDRLDTTAKERGVHIDTHVVDITNENIDEIFDSIIITFVLHHMDTEDATKLIAHAQEHTSDDGVHIISTFSNQGGLYERNKTTGRFYPSEEELRALYAHWDIKELSVKETTTHARNKNGERMRNNMVTLIAVHTKGDD